jgi:hypothetical protein
VHGREHPGRRRDRRVRLFATGDLAAFDADGTLRWYRSLVGDYPTITNQVGMAASPVLVKDRLIVPMDNAGESFLAAVDVKVREEHVEGRAAAGHQLDHPAGAHGRDATEVLFDAPSGLTAYDATAARSAGRRRCRRGRSRPACWTATRCTCRPAG